VKDSRLKLIACILWIVAFSWLGGFLIGRTTPNLCLGCEHLNHGSKACYRQVPCIIGTVACTCQGMELKRKQMLLGQDGK